MAGRMGFVGAIVSPFLKRVSRVAAQAAPVVRQIPQGLSNGQWNRLGEAVRSGAGHISDDIAVHGSRATGRATAKSDIDIAVRVDGPEFDRFVSQRFGTPNPGSAKERTMKHAARTGKVQSGEAGLRSTRKAAEEVVNMPVDLSVILRGGDFDRGPYLQLPGGQHG